MNNYDATQHAYITRELLLRFIIYAPKGNNLRIISGLG